MAITKAKKGEILRDLQEIFKNSLSIVFVNFHGLTSNDVNEVRSTLKKEHVGYLVAKKTLARKALGDMKVEGVQPDFTGELGIVYGIDTKADATAAVRGVYAFQKKLENKISILGGVFEGKYSSKDEMVAIAQIPSIQTLRGMFVNVINSPIQRMAIAMNEIAKKKTA